VEVKKMQEQEFDTNKQSGGALQMAEKNIYNDPKLKSVLKDIEKSFGKGAVMQLGDKADLDLEVISSGSLLINQALGVGGYPKGRIIEIYGPEMQLQKHKKKVALPPSLMRNML
jgi:recombination protein RecA